MRDVAAGSVENTRQVIERPGNVDVGNIYMPVLVRLERLLKAGSF